MRIGLILKIIAGLTVLTVLSFTALLAYHITVKPITLKPIAKIFDKIIPDADSLIKDSSEQDFAKNLEAAEMPDYEPGARYFQKAHELLALGIIEEGREKLLAIVNTFPSSPAAPTARRILSMMNLDEILSPSFTIGKSTYTVKRGDSYFAIAARLETSLDIIIHLNRMMELKNLQPGDELTYMPLNYRIVIEPHRKSLSLWQEARFIADYPILEISGTTTSQGKTSISSRTASIDKKTIQPTAPNYRASSKSITLKKPNIQILPYHESDETPQRGIYLKNSDLEELFLLTRTGNEVEFRSPKK
jgi:hypothetical protein